MFFRLYIAVSMLALSTQARAFDLEHTPPLVIQNAFALGVVQRDTELVCPDSKLPMTCEREFKLSVESFSLVEMMLRMSLIAHPGEESQALLKHAERLYQQGWDLYLNALAEYAIPPLTSPEVVGKSEVKE